MVYDGIHWNIYDILPYQRHFNFVNGIRSLGKTYTTQAFILEKCMKTGEEFMYVVRTQSEKKMGILGQAFQKVLEKEYPKLVVSCSTTRMFYTGKEGDPEKSIGWCMALSEYYHVKRMSFPNVKYILFDEYALEDSPALRYFNGWREPDVFLNLYHTVDRDQNKVICFFLGNSTMFYNPYHMHDAFRVQNVEPGGIWMNKNVLYQRPLPSEKLQEKMSASEFDEMIKNTNYGSMAVKGNYGDDTVAFQLKDKLCGRYVCTIVYDGNRFGIWNAVVEQGIVIVSDRIDPSCKTIFAFTIADHSEETTVATAATSSILKWVSHHFKTGNIRYTSPQVKLLFEPAWSKFVR